MMIYSRLLLIIFLVANFAACGFRLAGNSQLPPQLVSMQLLAENLNSRQKAELSKQLMQAGANLKDNQIEEVVRLTVSIENLPERNLVDTAGSGKTIIRLFRQLSYSLSSAAGVLLAEQETVIRQMDIELNSNNLAGLDYERQSAGALLDQALFGQMIFQLKHFQN